jgi:hypothetical protein
MSKRSVLLSLLLSLPALAEHPWAMRNATAARTGQSTYRGAAAGALEWRFPVGGRAPQLAVAEDGSIYAGVFTHNDTWSNEAYAYALTSAGTLKWRRKVTPYDWGASQDISGSPAIDGAGNLVLPSTYTQLLKLTKDGDSLFTYQGNTNYIFNSSPAVLSDDSIRHVIHPAGLLGLAADGTKLFAAGGNVIATVAVGANGDMCNGGVITKEPHGSLDIEYFNADGTLRWRRTSTFGAQGTAIFGADGTVYAPFLSQAFTPSGTVKWTASVPRTRTAALGRNGVLYFPSGGVIAVDAATGVTLWTLSIPWGVREEPAVDANGDIFLAGNEGTLWSVSSSGAVNFSVKVCDRFTTSPVVGATGNVLVAGVVGFQDFVFSIR